MVAVGPARTGRHRHERGLTLIELIVSIIILSIVGGVMAGAFGIGYHVVAKGGPTDRLTGAHDFMVLEQQLGKDGARAACVQVNGGTVYGKNLTATSCSASTGYGQVSVCASAALCFGWPQVSDSSCHVAAYSTSGTDPNVKVTRTEYSVALGSHTATTVTGGTLTEDTVTFQVPPQSGAVTTTTAPGGYAWVRNIPVTVTATGVTAGQFTQTLALHPVASDPGGVSSTITTSGDPC